MADVATKTIDIESAGEWVGIRRPGETVFDIYIRGDDVAEYQIDVNKGPTGDWVENVGPEYTGSADYDGGVILDACTVRIRCSKGTGNAGDEATLRISSGGF